MKHGSQLSFYLEIAEEEPDNPPAPLLLQPQLSPVETSILEGFLDLHQARAWAICELGTFPQPISVEAIYAYTRMKELPCDPGRFFELVRESDAVFCADQAKERTRNGHRNTRR